MSTSYYQYTNGLDRARGISTVLNRESRTVDHTVNDLVLHGLLSQPGFSGSIAIFRGLKYATIAQRWHQSVLVDFASQEGDMDATQWGPRSPQTVDVMHHATSHLYPRMSTYDTMSEFECLNLNIYSPAAALEAVAGHRQADANLPVIVWIHGGSFEWGDGSCECDGQYLVSHAMGIGMPVVVVAVNYRLGTLGFLTSKELRQEARERGEVGYSNLGFYDQRLALQWVRTNIHFFGGDASRITMAGESAGAISVLAHIRGTEPVAKNALLMSPATIYPRTFLETQITFDTICDKLRLAKEFDGNKIAALRCLPCEKLHELGADRLEIILCEDPNFFADFSGERFEEPSTFPSWLSRIVVGNTQEELGILGHYWALLSPKQLLDAWRNLYNDLEYATQVLYVYGVSDIQGPDSDLPAVASEQGRRLVQALIEYTGDTLFSKAVRPIAETHLAHRAISGQPQPHVYLYRFDQKDVLTADDSQRGKAYHSLDNAFFFHFPQVTGDGAPEGFRKTANAFSGMALRLAYDEDLWQPLGPASGNSRNTFATFSEGGLQERELAEPKWLPLVSSSENIDKFLLGKDLASKLAAFAVQAASNMSASP